jgi:predicted phosphodiesterase
LKRTISREELQTALSRYATQKEAAEALGISKDAMWRLVHSDETPEPISDDDTPEPVQTFQAPRKGDFSWEELLASGAARAKENDASDTSVDHGTVDLTKSTGAVGIFLISDLHIGSPNCDYLTFLAHTQALKTNPHLYTIWQGDVAEWAISQRMLDAVLGQVFPPQHQARIVRAVIKDLAHKTVAAVGGNHEGRVQTFSGFDIGEYLYDTLRESGGIYMRDGGVLKINVGGQTYTWRSTHGDSRFGSMYNPTHKATQLARMSLGFCDIVSTGHTHEAATMQMYVPGQDGSPPRPFIALQAGSYKTLYKEQYPTRLGYSHIQSVDMPGVILFPDKKVILPFNRMEDMVTVLEGLHAKD